MAGDDRDEQVRFEFGPVSRLLGARYFENVHFRPEAEAELRALHERGFVVHVMRTTAWVNYFYLSWALARRGLPLVRAVVNLRPWFTRPFRHTAQRGDFDVRFTYARRQGGSGLIFLKKTRLFRAEGKNIEENPFPALVAMARKGERNVLLVPELFAWEKRGAALKPSLIDRVFGSPEAPGFLHTMLAFFRNYRRAQFRVGEPIDLQRFIAEHPEDSDELIARKVKSSLYHHLARETRAVFGPPAKSRARFIDEALRDRTLRRSLDQVAQETQRSPQSLLRESKRHLNAIAARTSATMLEIASYFLSWLFNRLYDGIEVDEPGLHRALNAARHAPIVLCPSHKSHMDYLLLSWVLWNRGYGVPVVAAGANLSFFPLGPITRRTGAFFLRRSFKDDKVYTAAFKAYVKKLIYDGVPQEFFPEGTRSRSGKLLPPKLGMFTWQVEAVLEGASSDLAFVPVSIDYEKVVESGSHSRELAGAEKKPEDLKALLSTPKILTAQYGRIYLRFDEPVFLSQFMKDRGLKISEDISDEQKKSLVRALGNRVMYGISKVSTVTPHALVAAVLLSARGRGFTEREFSNRIGTLRRVAEEQQAPFSNSLKDAPNSPTTLGAIQDAVRTFCSDGLVYTQEVKGEISYSAREQRRGELSFYKNTLMNLMAPRCLVAHAVLQGNPASYEAVKARTLVLSRLFKIEFIYRVGLSFDALFAETVDRLGRMGLLLHTQDTLQVAPEAHAAPELTFLSDLLRDYLEAYLSAALTLEDVAKGVVGDRRTFVKAAMETGRAEFLAGRIKAPESMAKPTLENALAFFLDQKVLLEEDRKLKLGPQGAEASARKAWVEDLRGFVAVT